MHLGGGSSPQAPSPFLSYSGLGAGAGFLLPEASAVSFFIDYNLLPCDSGMIHPQLSQSLCPQNRLKSLGKDDPQWNQ